MFSSFARSSILRAPRAFLLRLDTLHAEFADALEPEATREVANLWNGYGDVKANTDVQGHGTHCAGTVGGLTVGVAPGASVYGVKVHARVFSSRPPPSGFGAVTADVSSQ